MGGREDQGRANPSAAFGKQMSRADQGPGRRRPTSGGVLPKEVARLAGRDVLTRMLRAAKVICRFNSIPVRPQRDGHREIPPT